MAKKHPPAPIDPLPETEPPPAPEPFDSISDAMDAAVQDGLKATVPQVSGPAPTVGRIVHYNEVDGPRAAIVVATPETDPSLPIDRIAVTVFYRSGPHSAAPTMGTETGQWQWPPRA